MTTVRRSELIEAPPHEVWRIVADPRNLPRWNTRIREVRDVPDGELRTGHRYRVLLRVMGVPIEARAEVRELQPERYAEVVVSGPVDATVRTYLRPVGARRTRLEHEVRYRLPGGPLGNVVGRAVNRLGAGTILRRGIRAQKEQVERG